MANREFVVLMLPFSMSLATIPAYFRATRAKLHVNPSWCKRFSFVLRQYVIACFSLLGFFFYERSKNKQLKHHEDPS